MRLTEEQVKVIKEGTARHFGATARVLLFGVRVDDAKGVDDIDLVVGL